MLSASAPTVQERFPLGMPWPTVDPFLFCVHHRDHYPAANGAFGPSDDLAGRQLGSDFSYKDGWSMYHGNPIPGFPQHPHRGFETITYARRGLIDHADSLGATARFGRGDVQWMTAGSGIVHSEMFPLLETDADNPLELFQIWLNLPAASKFVDPYFTMLWDRDIPRHAEPGVAWTVIAGRVHGLDPASPPPDSWAAEADHDVAIWHGVIDADATWRLPAAQPGTNRAIYVFDGAAVDVDGDRVDRGYGAIIRSDRATEVQAVGATSECLVLQGRPIAEPVAQHGPFVMNTRAEIMQAFEDYQRTQFGGWPWPDDGPVHGESPERFAVHPDGRTERST